MRKTMRVKEDARHRGVYREREMVILVARERVMAIERLKRNEGAGESC